MIRIYIAGPYSGENIINIRNAIIAANAVMDLDRGFLPFIPHLCGFWDMVTPKPYEAWIYYSKEWLLQCEAMLRLPGDSPGSDYECEVARQSNIPIFYSIAELRDSNLGTLLT